MPVFDSTDSGAKVTYETWRFDLKLHRGQFRDDALLAAAYRSLRGKPGVLARSLGRNITLDGLIQGMDKYFGRVSDFNSLMTALYQLKQNPNEAVRDYAVRLVFQIAQIKNEYEERFLASTTSEDRLKG